MLLIQTKARSEAALPQCSVFSITSGTLNNTVFSWRSWREGEVLQFLHAIRTFSLEIKGLSRERERDEVGRGRISLTVALPSQKSGNL